MKLRDSHHVANLGVLVGLGTKEGLAIRHGNWVAGSLGESLEISKISAWVNQTTSNSVGVSSDGANDADTAVLGTTHVVKQQVDQQKVTKVVDTLSKKKLSTVRPTVPPKRKKEEARQHVLRFNSPWSSRSHRRSKQAQDQ